MMLSADCVFAILIAALIGTRSHVLSSEDPMPHCIWYGECGDGYNCYYPGNAKQLKDPTSIAKLRETCPHMMPNGSTGTPVMTCCDPKQIHTFYTQMAIPKTILSRCPACLQNFMTLFCHLTCDPHQSAFMAVNKSDIKPDKKIPSVYYAVSKKYAYGMFNSCKDVQNPSSGKKALDMMCGREAAQCTPENWLEFMGNKKQNPMAPFMIFFNVSANATIHLDKINATLKPMNDSTIPCNTSCSCQDCQSACQPVPPDIPPENWLILGFDPVEFIAACAYCAFIIIFGAVHIWVFFYCPPTSKSEPVNHGTAGESADTATQTATPGCCDKSRVYAEEFLKWHFRRWGCFCARHFIIVPLVSIFVCLVLSLGICFFQVTSDPVQLWSAPDSRARQEKDYFDTNFSPFFRTEMLIITAKNNSQWLRPDTGESTDSHLYGPVLRKEILKEVLNLQMTLANLTVWSEKLNRNVTLEDICFAPLSPDNQKCTIMSILNYFQNIPDNLDVVVMEEEVLLLADYITHFSICARDPLTVSDLNLHGTNMSCLADFGGPIMPWVTLGGYPDDNYENATALVITYTVNNFQNDDFQEMATTWESAFLDYLHNFKGVNISVNYSAERSIQDELNRESQSDIFTVLISYIVMFAYITLTLGRCYPFSRLFVNSKVVLGLSGVIIVLLSVVSSIGFFSYIHIPATLIIIEVVPFLVLAVGVDNIFILVQTFQRYEEKEGETVEERVGEVVGRVGPSMLLTSLSESLAFFLGALTTMPAVKVFSLYAAMALLIDFLLQMTVFVCLLTLDAKRQQANRLEICCNIQLPPYPRALNDECKFGFLFHYFTKYYAKFLLTRVIRPLVIVIFVTWAFVCAAVVNKVDIGLDQKLSMPRDSYVLRYFTSMEKYLSVGSPVYFVVESGHDYTTVEGQNQICGGSGCPDDSLLGQVYQATRVANKSHIAYTPSSWLDDYFDWLNPGSGCCREFANASFCPSTVDVSINCTLCNITHTEGNRPVGSSFMEFLHWFLVDNPGVSCPKGGHAAYGSAVKLQANNSGIGATYFMTYHSVLKTSHDFTDALRYARELGDNITRMLLNSNTTTEDSQLSEHDDPKKVRPKVFPYSVFYVFYEQYLTIVDQTVFNLGLSLAAIFVVTFILLGCDLWTSVIILIVIAMILLSMFGLMFFWSISLNALSLVNLVMCVGISVEFCSHIARAFAVSAQPTRILRAYDAVSHMGSSVLSGITLTKIFGIFVLAFSKSQLFEVFYFRMYFGVVLFGATHGLVFLPVLLSYVGPTVNYARIQKHSQTCSKRNDSNDEAHPVTQGTSEDDDAITSSERDLMIPSHSS